jgi:hypothetical protein
MGHEIRSACNERGRHGGGKHGVAGGNAVTGASAWMVKFPTGVSVAISTPGAMMLMSLIVIVGRFTESP